MAKLTLTSDEMSPIFLKLDNIDLARYVLAEGTSFVRICFSSGIEDVIPMPSKMVADEVLQAIADHSSVDTDLTYNITHKKTTYEVDSVVVSCIQAGQKIPAIKRYREVFGIGLKEAKDDVDIMYAEFQAGREIKYPTYRQPKMRRARGSVV